MSSKIFHSVVSDFAESHDLRFREGYIADFTSTLKISNNRSLRVLTSSRLDFVLHSFVEYKSRYRFLDAEYKLRYRFPGAKYKSKYLLVGGRNKNQAI